jgi:N-acetylglucosamine kinase-like BadF-type ATPase
LNKYIIGIDGGGTKTIGVLYDLEGREVKRVQNGFSNISVDEAQAKNTIIKTINELIEEIPNNQLAMIQMGIAGISKLTDKDAYIDELIGLFKTKVNIVTDAEIALYSIKKDTDNCVVMVLGGTGSAIMVSQKDQTTLFGGFGHLLGDEGSGYHLAITALKNIIKQYEEQMEVTPLSNAILQKIGMGSYQEIKAFVYNNPKSEVAQLSQFIAEHAIQGDNDAIQLFRNEGVHLARQTINAYNTLHTCQEVIIAFRGGFLKHAPYVKDTLIQELEKHNILFVMDEEEVEPVKGSYYLAKRNLQKEVEEWLS